MSMMGRLAEKIGVNRAVLALSAARLGDAVGNSILFVIIPLYVAKLPAPWFHLPESIRVGLLIALYGVVNATLQPFMGAWSDRAGRRKIFIQVGLIMMAMATLAFVAVSRFADLLALRAFQGVGVALSIPASMALMAASTQKSTRGGAMGFYSTFRMIGFTIGPLLGGFLFDRLGFNASFYVGSGFILLGAILVQFWVHDQPASISKSDPEFRILDRSLFSAGILGAGLATFVMASDFSMISSLEVPINARLNETAFGFGIAFSAVMIARLLFQIPLGRLSDRIGRRPLIIGGLILMAPATALLGEALTTVQLTALRLIQGVASAGIAAPAFAVAADLSRAGGEGRQMSIITMGFGFGIALGPLISGVLAVLFFELPFLVGGAMSLAAAWVVFRYVPETVNLRPSSGSLRRR